MYGTSTDSFICATYTCLCRLAHYTLSSHAIHTCEEEIFDVWQQRGECTSLNHSITLEWSKDKYLMDNVRGDPEDEKDSVGGAMVTFAWRPSNSLGDGEVIKLVQLAGNFSEWQPIDMTPPPLPKTRSMSCSSASSDCGGSDNMNLSPNLNHLGYWTLQRFLSPGSYEYKYVVTSANQNNGGSENVVWLHDVTKDSKPDGMGGSGRNNILQVEDFHDGKGDSISLSRTLSHDEATTGPSDISDDSDEDEDISIIQKGEVSGDGWVVLSRNREFVSQEKDDTRERKSSSDSDETDKISVRSSESSIEIIEGPDSSQGSRGSQCNDTDISKRELPSRKSTMTPARAPGCDIERKFLAPSDYLKRLKDSGFVPVKHFRDEILDDCYYDFVPTNTASKETGGLVNEYPLLSNDHWLRQRNDDWELKYPVNSDHSLPSSLNSNAVSHLVSHYESQKFGKMVLYHQTTCPDDILAKLKIITLSAIKDGESLNDLLSNGLLRPFSKIQTSRNCFKYNDTSEKISNSRCDVNIIVEMTSWGCLIGEIEVIVESKQEVSLAFQEIDRLSKILAFEPLDLTKMAISQVQ